VTISPGKSLRELRERKPLVHQITNYVVMNETANATLALGALPVMAHAREEVEEMVGLASALVLNIGTLSPHWVEAMLLAGRAANERGVPIVLDPVGAGATRYRTQTALKLLDELHISVLRGNAGEIAALLGKEAEVRGVESIEVSSGAHELAEQAAGWVGAAAVTGPVDYICDGERMVAVSNGHPLLGKITGTGCMATTMIACFHALDSTDPVGAAVQGLATFGVAAENAAEQARGPGSFHAALYDALAALDPEALDARVRLAETVA
jgi:hydroxyethylthiazole kinase